ncbi:MAG: hypothetical protein V3T58_04325 [Candidatus Hydrothermarchaeales archaeon]
MSGVEVELREIKDTLRELNEKLNELLDEREALAITSLSEKSLSEFLSSEPELYTPRDVKVRYK